MSQEKTGSQWNTRCPSTWPRRLRRKADQKEINKMYFEHRRQRKRRRLSGQTWERTLAAQKKEQTCQLARYKMSGKSKAERSVRGPRSWHWRWAQCCAKTRRWKLVAAMTQEGAAKVYQKYAEGSHGCKQASLHHQTKPYILEALKDVIFGE